jgi:hypothetical protein
MFVIQMNCTDGVIYSTSADFTLIDELRVITIRRGNLSITLGLGTVRARQIRSVFSIMSLSTIQDDVDTS